MATDKESGFATGRPERPEPIDGFANFGRIPLDKIPNARDLGGMPAADGKHIRMFRLIRSGDLHDASSSDASMLIGEYGVERIVDFRTKAEADSRPNDMAELPEVVLYRDPVFSEEAAGITHANNPVEELRELLQSKDGPFDKVRDLYATMVLGDEGIRAYREFMEILAGAQTGATLWNCTEGKDRTGVGAMLIEYALGVPMECIRRDYLATNLFAPSTSERFLDGLGHLGIAKGLDADMDAFMYAYSGYLDHAIEAIEGEYGSIEAYLDKALGVDGDVTAQLREMYLA